MSHPNYFAELGVDPTATLEEVRRAFRRLALRYHPDRNPGDSSSVEMYLKITKAYQSLNSENALREMRKILATTAEESRAPSSPKPGDRRLSVIKQSSDAKCARCKGRREIKIKRGAFVRTQVCPDCAKVFLSVK